MPAMPWRLARCCTHGCAARMPVTTALGSKSKQDYGVPGELLIARGVVNRGDHSSFSVD